jgi:glycosyltransferase involved in cell wall biosynthesis
MPRLKILQLFSRYLQYGGEEGSVYRIGDALQAQYGVEYFMASSEELMRVPRLLLPVLACHNFPVLKRLENYQRIGKFDVWQIHNVFPAISPGAYALAGKLGVPIIHYLHNYRMGCVNGFWFTRGEDCQKCSGGNFLPGVLGKCWRNSYAQSAAMALMLAGMRRSGLFEQVRRWVAISHAQKEAHVRIGLPADRIDVVHHFLERDANAPVPPFPANGYALFIGRLSPEKGVGHLLEAWATLAKTRHLVIAGDGPEMAALQSKAARLGLDNVTFTGFVARAAQHDLWAGAAFSVVPSRWQEPFGMVVLEAWAQARPVVTHRIGALPELITHGVNGFLADPSDSHDLAAVLEECFQSGQTLRDMGQNGMERLLTHHHKALWMKQIEQVYHHAGLI